MTNVAIISVGSNIDPEANIARTLEILAGMVTIIKVSAMIKTKPVGITNQPDFTNGAVRISTSLEKAELTRLLKEVENRMGRDRSLPRFGPRTIDLDIVVWNGEIVDMDYYARDFLKRVVDEIN